MNEPKPFASLSPSLLARKGGARPAMRPQIQPLQQFHDNAARQIEDDLGWNDMGHDVPAPKPVEHTPPPQAEVVALKPLAPPPVPRAKAPVMPEVLRQQAEIADRVAEAPALKKAPAVKDVESVRRSALSDGRRAAFTLRLDAERHLKLRLACTIANRSAQQIVTDALDQFIATLPEVAALAAQVKKRG